MGLEAKNRKTLQFKRSFFVRMVSDPKIYNPKIVKLKQDMSLVDETPSSPTMSGGDGATNMGVSMRFRNWNTTITTNRCLTLKPHGHSTCTTPSPSHTMTDKRIEEKENGDNDGLRDKGLESLETLKV